MLRTRPPSPTTDGRLSSRTHPRRSTPAQPRHVKIDADAVDLTLFSTASAAQELTAAAAYTAIRRSAVMPKDASSLACQTRRSATSWAASRLTPRRSTSRFSRPPQGEGFLSGRRRLPRRFPSSSPAAGVPGAAAWPRAILPPGFSVPDERATSSAFRLAGSGDTRTV